MYYPLLPINKKKTRPKQELYISKTNIFGFLGLYWSLLKMIKTPIHFSWKEYLFSLQFLLTNWLKICTLSIVDKLANKMMGDIVQRDQKYAFSILSSIAPGSVNPSTALADEFQLQQKDSLCYKTLRGCFVYRKHTSRFDICPFPVNYLSALRVLFRLGSPWWHLRYHSLVSHITGKMCCIMITWAKKRVSKEQRLIRGKMTLASAQA